MAIASRHTCSACAPPRAESTTLRGGRKAARAAGESAAFRGQVYSRVLRIPFASRSRRFALLLASLAVSFRYCRVHISTRAQETGATLNQRQLSARCRQRAAIRAASLTSRGRVPRDVRFSVFPPHFSEGVNASTASAVPVAAVVLRGIVQCDNRRTVHASEEEGGVRRKADDRSAGRKGVRTPAVRASNYVASRQGASEGAPVKPKT